MIKKGDRFKTNAGGTVVVVEYVDYLNIKVKFEDEFEHCIVTDGYSLKAGLIKNPYARLIFGVGYFGVGKHKSKIGATAKGYPNSQVYCKWINMLSRCYNPNYNSRRFYIDCSVSEQWHCFQNFAEWYTKELKYTGWQGRIYLDKDILGTGTEYSEDTCCLVPADINSNFTKRINWYEGKERENYAKLNAIKLNSLAEKYKDYLNPKVYAKLVSMQKIYS